LLLLLLGGSGWEVAAPVFSCFVCTHCKVHVRCVCRVLAAFRVVLSAPREPPAADAAGRALVVAQALVLRVAASAVDVDEDVAADNAAAVDVDGDVAADNAAAVVALRAVVSFVLLLLLLLLR